MRTRKRTAPADSRTAGCVSLLPVAPVLTPTEPLPPGFVLLTKGWIEGVDSTERIGLAGLTPGIVLLPHPEPVHWRAGGSLGTGGGGFVVVGGFNVGGLVGGMGLVGDETGTLDCGAERGISAKLG